ncbi:Endonuclease/exonuclease/phosphatase [Artemisia annua]|uniref:Endonuclease/exonuclease/phosphatase n=1 Tax=Artemisia annua TaxID=35608 RepID=A0A2U1NVV6_ARTAN|nr:Endonuclease/exonuclease/phosphatase [Artemisia annua]
MECNDFLHQGGGWIEDTCDNNVNGDSLKSSELAVEGILEAVDNDANSTEDSDTSDFSKNTATCDSQTTPTSWANVDFGSPSHQVPETQFKLRSPIRQSTFVESVNGKGTSDVDYLLDTTKLVTCNERYVPTVPIIKVVPTLQTQINIHVATYNSLPVNNSSIHNKNDPTSVLSPSLPNTSPLNNNSKPTKAPTRKSQKNPLPQPKSKRCGKIPKAVSIKLFDPLNGRPSISVNKKQGKDKPPKPTTSQDNSSSNTDSNIRRCNNRIINQTNSNSSPGNNPSTSNNDIEIAKTIDVGTSIGYNMKGKEADVLDIIASLNANGVCTAPKKKRVRKLCFENKISFIGIQESKCSRDDHTFIHSLWGKNSCDYALKKRVGLSGGIIAIWNDLFKKNKIIDEEDGFLAIYGHWIKCGIDCLMVVVYAPQDINRKLGIWKRLTDLTLSFHGMCIILGDFNEVRSENERLGTSFCKRDIWIGEQKLETLFPRLFSLEVNKDCKVVDRCNLNNGPHTRTWQWRRPVRDGVEKEQLDGLLNILRHFNPSSSNDRREYSIDASVVYAKVGLSSTADPHGREFRKSGHGIHPLLAGPCYAILIVAVKRMHI